MEGKFKSVDTETFFETLFDSILKVENTYVGKNTENTYTFSTVKTCKNRENVTKIQVLSDKERKIHGINLEYDGVYKSEMFPKNLEEELAISLEMEMKFLRCKKCGQMAALLKASRCPVCCCGEPMEELVAGTTEASREKHIPVVEISDGKAS